MLPLLLAVALAITSLTGCKERRVEYSSPLVTTRIVTSKKHRGEYYLNPVDNVNPMKDIDPLFDYKKDRWLTKTKESFYVTIDTPQCRFRVKDRNLYDRVVEGQEVNVFYKNVYSATYDDVDGDGRKDLVSRTLVDYSFLQADPK